MLTLIARRARVQLPLLTAILAVVTIGATLLGVCALLLTTSQERALDTGIARAPSKDVDVTAFTSNVRAENADAVATDARTVLTRALAPLGSTSATRASTAMRRLGPADGPPRRLAYLSGIDGLPDRARLTTGHWPTAAAPATAGTTAGTTKTPGTTQNPLEAVVLEPTAQALGLSVGSRVRLGAEVPPVGEGDSVTVTVVGIVRPLPDAGWDRDPLAAAGYVQGYTNGRNPVPLPAYGPFVVALPDLFASRSTMERLQVTAHPNLSAPTSTALDAVATAINQADPRLSAVLGNRVGIERVASDLPVSVALAHTQQNVTRSTVLIVVLLGTVLTAAALGLAGRLVVALRTTETALFSALGASRGQLAVTAAVEAVALAVLAAVLAVPLSALAHSGLTHLPPLVRAGLAAPPEVTGPQLTAVVLGALLLATVLVVPTLRPGQPTGAPTRGQLGPLTRSGADLLLLAVAVAGWWQLHAQPSGQTGLDTVRVLAPVLCLLAGAALAPRLVAPPLRAGERLARRSRGLVLPLAAFEAARRPRAVAAALLLALAAAAGSFGLAFGATWQQSQHDQADTRTGTDLTLALTAPTTAGQGAAVAAATGGVVSPVTDRGVLVGQWVGDTGPPQLVAVDTRRAGGLVRGRLSAGTSWAQVGAALTPKTTVTGVALPPSDSGQQLTVTGQSAPGPQLRVVPQLVLQDRDGLRTPCQAAAVSLDGRAHPLQLSAPLRDGQRLVGVLMQIELDPDAPPRGSAVGKGLATISLNVPVPHGTTAGAGAGARPAGWTATPVGDVPNQIISAATTARSTSAAVVVRTRVTVNLADLPYEALQLMTTAFKRPPAMPVAVSEQFVSELGTSLGKRLTVSVGTAPVPVVVARIVPTVPAQPNQVAMLADGDTLSRSLLVTGDLAPPVDAWWVGSPTVPQAASRAAGLGLGSVVTRAEAHHQLTGGPLRIALPAALAVLVPAAILLALAGTVMHVTSDVEARALEMARLRGLGLTRRNVLRGLLIQHGGVLALLLLAGTAVGAVVSWAVGPALIRSDVGAAPVPVALAHWPWSAETGLLAVLLLTGLAAVTLVIAVQVRRADATHLRAGA